MPSSDASVVVLSDSDDDDAALSRPTTERIASTLRTLDEVEALCRKDGVPREFATRIASTLRTQDEVEALCRKHGVPREFAARPAGADLRACSPPPKGAVCMYKHVLEAGVRVPLHAFFSEALASFGLAPGQLAPKGWRVLVGFVALCHDAGVQPSLPVFCHFFWLVRRKDWYYFRCKGAAGELFTGLTSPKPESKWKGGFFFLTSPEPWPCPVRWGGDAALKKSTVGPGLTSKEEKSVEKLLGVHPGTAVDLRTYLRKVDLAASLSCNLTGKSPPPPQPSPRSSGAKGMDLSAAREASVASETDKSRTTEQGGEMPFIGKKRKRAEAAPLGSVSAPPGLGPKPRHLPEAKREVLESVVTPSREREFADDFVASSNVAMRQAARDAENAALREKLAARDAEVAALARDAEVAALREKLAAREVADLRNKLAAQDAQIAALARDAEVAALREKQAAREIAALQEKLDKAEAAAQQFVGSEEDKRRLAEHALEGFERGAEEMKHVALRLCPGLDASSLVV